MIARLLAAALALLIGAASARAEPGHGCAPLRFEGADYIVCAFDARRDDIKMYWMAPDHAPYAGFSRLVEAQKAQGRQLVFAINAGMFATDFSPLGLLIEGGKLVHKADTRDGPGNFHLKPNGVFYVGEGSAGVMETTRFLQEAPKASYATQSGPLMVEGGRIHPKISPTGTSAKVRNGVGVREGHLIFFALSQEPVTFFAFARLFRDGLNCPDALFLDGTVSAIYSPELERLDSVAPFGPIIGVSIPSK